MGHYLQYIFRRLLMKSTGSNPITVRGMDGKTLPSKGDDRSSANQSGEMGDHRVRWGDRGDGRQGGVWKGSGRRQLTAWSEAMGRFCPSHCLLLFLHFQGQKEAPQGKEQAILGHTQVTLGGTEGIHITNNFEDGLLDTWGGI